MKSTQLLIRKYLSLMSLILLCGLAFHFSATSSQAGTQLPLTSPSFKKVMIVLFENTSYQDALNQPFFAKIAREGALLTNLMAEVHPSQGNYIGLTAGSTYGVTSDRAVTLDVRHVGDLLEAKGKSWKVYLEQYPGDCFVGKSSGTYVRKHNPFISFKNIQSDPVRCKAHLVDASVLAQDIQNGSVPDYSIYIPDMNNDGHDTGVQFADSWYSNTFGPLLANTQFMRNLLLVSTFDESGFGSSANHIYGSLYGDSVIAGSQASGAYTHFSLLHTIESALGLGDLGQQDATAPLITGVWK